MDDKKSAPADAPTINLVVIHPFGERAKGNVITDPDEIADVLAGENARHVNKIKAQ